MKPGAAGRFKTMDFPIFHLDWMGNRMLIALIAIVHVMINHAFAVGFIPVVTLLEYLGYRKQKNNPIEARKWDRLAYKLMFIAFVVTTGAGALTGVGIWFSTSLVNPDAVGSLIRIFYGAWFSEWIIFALEVVFVMIYFLRWKTSDGSPAAKRKHIQFGVFLSIFSWLTMAIIVAILGFMMDPGKWGEFRTFFSGFANPLYIPQLYFRTPLAMMLGGASALFAALFILKKDNTIRNEAVSHLSLWVLIWAPVCAVGALLYRTVIPEAMIKNLPTAVATMTYSRWYESLLWIILGAVMLSILTALWGFLKPRRLPRFALVLPLLALFVFLGSFERIREFVRKPYIIGQYMYANGLRVEDYPGYKEKGILHRAQYVSTSQVTESNKIEAGKNVFLLACSRCHTVGGINSVVDKFKKRFAGAPLQVDAIKNYIPKMNQVWYYMPPFPGNEAELDALTAFIIDAGKNGASVQGAQTIGLPRRQKDNRDAAKSKEDIQP